jgi:uncharacterized protein (DUF2141 family)
MSKLTTATFAAAALLAGAGIAAPVAAAPLGPDAAACAAGAGQPALLVRVEGFKARTGALRVQLYGPNPQDFLAKGRKMRRIDLGVSRAGPMEVCVALPAPGRYAVAVRHDIDGSGKSGWNDGGGFSRNPHLSLFSLKPRYEDVAISAGSGVKPVEVMLNYRNGLSIGPVSQPAGA